MNENENSAILQPIHAMHETSFAGAFFHGARTIKEEGERVEKSYAAACILHI